MNAVPGDDFEMVKLRLIGGPECGTVMPMTDSCAEACRAKGGVPDVLHPDGDNHEHVYVLMSSQPDWMVQPPVLRPLDVIYIWEPLYSIAL